MTLRVVLEVAFLSEVLDVFPVRRKLAILVVVRASFLFDVDTVLPPTTVALEPFVPLLGCAIFGDEYRSLSGSGRSFVDAVVVKHVDVNISGTFLAL